MENWCLVIVASKKGSYEYFFNTTWPSVKERMIFLSPDDQARMNSKFIAKLPWNEMGRKNVGYLFAMFYGAEFIFDFDDESRLKFWMTGAAEKLHLDYFTNKAIST